MTKHQSRMAAFIGLVAVIAVTIIVVVFGGFYQVDQGERGVLLRNGKIVAISEPGLGFKTPLLDKVAFVSVRDHTTQIAMNAYSNDQQSSDIIVSVTYRVPDDKVATLYSEYGTIEALSRRVIERRVPDVVKNVFGSFTAARSIQERTNLGTEINEAVRKSMVDAPIVIVSVQVESVTFSKTYEDSIEKRMLAQVQIETTRQQKETAKVQAEIKVVEAKAEADAQRERFQAQADGIRLRGEAEAQAIRARGQALASNSNLVDMMAVEKWDGVLPTTQVPGSTVPFLNVK